MDKCLKFMLYARIASVGRFLLPLSRVVKHKFVHHVELCRVVGLATPITHVHARESFATCN